MSYVVFSKSSIFSICVNCLYYWYCCYCSVARIEKLLKPLYHHHFQNHLAKCLIFTGILMEMSTIIVIVIAWMFNNILLWYIKYLYLQLSFWLIVIDSIQKWFKFITCCRWYFLFITFLCILFFLNDFLLFFELFIFFLL